MDDIRTQDGPTEEKPIPVLRRMKMYSCQFKPPYAAGRATEQHEFTLGADETRISPEVTWAELDKWLDFLAGKLESEQGPIDPETMTLDVWKPLTLETEGDGVYRFLWGFAVRPMDGKEITP